MSGNRWWWWLALLTLGCGNDVTTGGARDAGGSRPTADAGGTGDELALEAASLVSDARGRFDVTGRGLDGQDALASVAGHNAFWFAWSVFHPGSELFGTERGVREATIESSDECTVPCREVAPACGGRDCIPALQSPTMVGADDPSLSFLRDVDEVLGVITPSGPRAYPHNILWWHEIVNEEVDGEAFSVTFCPLTGSGLAFDRRRFVEGSTVELGVSGNLYNSNLVMYDRTSESFWSQMRLESISGTEIGTPSPILPVFEMTWGAWKALHPDTRVVSSDTGHSRDYTRYPYGDYRVNDTNTFRATNPPPDDLFDNKDMVFGVVVDGTLRGYAWDVLAETSGSPQGVVHDEVAGAPIVLVHDLRARYVHAFRRDADERFTLVAR